MEITSLTRMKRSRTESRGFRDAVTLPGEVWCVGVFNFGMDMLLLLQDTFFEINKETLVNYKCIGGREGAALITTLASPFFLKCIEVLVF